MESKRLFNLANESQYLIERAEKIKSDVKNNLRDYREFDVNLFYIVDKLIRHVSEIIRHVSEIRSACYGNEKNEVQQKPGIPSDLVNFSEALKFLKNGFLISRVNWLSNHMGVFDTFLGLTHPICDLTQEFIYKENSQKERSVYTFSNEDILATDWLVFDRNK